MSDQNRSATAEGTQRKIVFERTYRARVEEIWELWTTKDGFESWWGPEGFRVEVHTLEAHVGGALHYDMIADAPEQIEAMKQIGRPTSHETRGRFTEMTPQTRLAITHAIDFLPDKPLTVASYIGGDLPTAYVESVGVGDHLPAIPLFLTEYDYVPCPLDATYEEAWRVFPAMLKEILERPG